MGHAKETCHNIKREQLTVLVIPTKVVESVAKGTAQPVQLAKVPLKYPCII